jgi:hypothetical protein
MAARELVEAGDGEVDVTVVLGGVDQATVEQLLAVDSAVVVLPIASATCPTL